MYQNTSENPRFQSGSTTGCNFRRVTKHSSEQHDRHGLQELFHSNSVVLFRAHTNNIQYVLSNSLLTEFCVRKPKLNHIISRQLTHYDIMF